MIAFLSQLHRKFRHDRKAATAMVMALAMVPMIIATGAAVDFSRVSSARAQLQMAVDAAALAGVGAYQTSQQGVNSGTVVNSAFTTSETNLTNYVKINSTAVTIGCSGAAGDSNCGTASTAANVANSYGVTACANSASYCVQITASATMKNSLLAAFIPTDALTAKASASSPFPKSQFKGAGGTVASAYDENAIYGYGVPLSKSNAPLYNQLPPSYSNCSGPIKNTTTAPAGTTCPYYQVGDSTGVTIPAQPTLNLAAGQPIAFLFVNVTGNHTNYNYVQEPDGGYCPDYSLYGSISQEPQAIVPSSDSTNIYSSAYEMIGDPPTYSSNQSDEGPSDPIAPGTPFGTNHIITPFQVPAGTNVGIHNNLTVITSKVENCPYFYYNYQGAPAIYTGVDNKTYATYSRTNGYPRWTATYFPPNDYYGGVSPPKNVAGCTPNSSATPWNYSGNNLGNCANGAYTTGGLSTGQQTAKYNNCALLIENLGYQATPILPTSYQEFQASPNQNSKLADAQGRPYLIPDYSGVIQKGSSILTFPPDDTAHKCWTPTETDTTASDYDLIENPQLGAIACGTQTPNTYALYWNDMGSNESDDLGYWNAITLFTCSTPSGGAGSGGSSSLSG